MHLKHIRLDPEKYPTRKYYPFNLDIFKNVLTLAFRTPVTFFIGENGSGKSTLLEAVARRCGIRIWEGYERTRIDANPYRNMLTRAITPSWSDGSVPGSFFASQIFLNFAGILDEWASTDPGVLDYFGGESLRTQSHGQSLMAFFKNRYRIKGLYLLDEPETALSPRSQLDLLTLLKKMGDAGHAQFIVATHSPILLACPGAEIYTFDQSPISSIDYENTDYYTVYRDFLLNRSRYVQL